MDEKVAQSAPDFLDLGDRPRLAYRRISGAGAGVVWLGGFRSDMLGSKAEALARWAQAKSRSYLRFDYRGHGESEGAFEDGCISDWRDDALAVFDAASEGPQILVGSSMGAWITTLLALERPERIAGIVFIAPAPDFTEALMWAQFSPEIRSQIETLGVYAAPSEYEGGPTPISRKLIEDGRENLVLDGSVDINVPIRVLQGMADPDVPWRHAMGFVEQLVSEDIVTTLIKNGDHRLSDPENLRRLLASVEELALKADAAG